MDDYWILEGIIPKKASFGEWGQWFEDKNNSRKVNKTQLGNVVISTVFLGLNHNFSGIGAPILFETLVFGGAFDQSMERYRTWAEAEAGHEEMVMKVVYSQTPQN